MSAEISSEMESGATSRYVVTVIARDLMHRHLTPRSLERAQWFADLNTALAEAEELLVLLQRDGNFPSETVRLRQRIETLRAELAQLNRGMLGEGRIVGRDWPASRMGGG